MSNPALLSAQHGPAKTAKTEAKTEGRTLVLHFDINKTIVLVDNAKGAGREAMVSALLSEACWGRWEPSQASSPEAEAEALRSWRLEAGPCIPCPRADLVSYAELLEQLRMPKASSSQLKQNFTELGQPGESVRGVYVELLQRLKLPSGISSAIAAEGHHFILPSFFKLLLHLEQQRRDYRLVFRTFGNDLLPVVEEFNLFCSGEHPCYPQVPSTMLARRIALPRDSGEWYRDASGQVHLSLCSAASGVPELVTQAHGTQDCFAALQERFFGPHAVKTMALRDYFPHWRARGEADDSGKVLILPSSRGGDAVPQHIFFDDNIERDRSHIVDARDVENRPLPFEEMKGVHLIRAEPLLAIRNMDYFIEALAMAEAALEKRGAAGHESAP